MGAKVIEEMATEIKARLEEEARRTGAWYDDSGAYMESITYDGEFDPDALARAVWPIARAAALREAAGIAGSFTITGVGDGYTAGFIRARAYIAAALLKEAETTEGK